MMDKARNNREQHIRYKLEKWKNIVTFDILNNISKNVTLVQLMNSVGKASHAVSLEGKCIFDFFLKPFC